MVTRGRSALLEACLASLAAQVDAPEWDLRILADGDPTAVVLVREHIPSAEVGVFRDARPGGARNFLLEGARGDLLLFLDDDVVVGPHLLRHLSDLAAEHPGVSVFGGPNETPRGSSRFQVVQGAALASMVGAGPVRRRYGAHPSGEADERWFTLCNLAVRREAMRPFSDRLVCAEENEVLEQLSRDGHQMLYDPALVAYHERRPTYGGFVRQMVKYGRGRGQLTRRRPSSLNPAFLLPTALVGYLVALLPLAMVAGPRAALPLAAYAAAVLVEAVKVAATLRRPRHLPLAAALIVTLHLAYGVGVMRGLVEPTRRRARGQAEWSMPSNEAATATAVDEVVR